MRAMGTLGENTDITTNMSCLVYMKLVKPDLSKWNAQVLESVMKLGYQLYVDSYNTYKPKDVKLGLANVVRQFIVKEKLQVFFDISKPIIGGVFNVDTVTDLLQRYFEKESFCLLTYGGKWVSVYSKSGFIYYFDPYSRSLIGDVCDRGSGILMKISTVKGAAVRIVNNLKIDNLRKFAIVCFRVKHIFQKGAGASSVASK